MTFQFYALRFAFRAQDPVYFPEGKSGNIIRGAFGAAFKRAACVPSCRSARECESRASCAYARIFEVTNGEGPSGLADPPRPFVFRAAHLDGRTFAPGQPFHFDLHLFDVRDPALPYFVFSFAQLGGQGMGPRRGRAELMDVSRIGDGSTAIYADGRLLGTQALAPKTLSLAPERREIRRVIVRFKTPTELKAESALAQRPEFGVLFARIRDRVSTLRRAYGAGALDIDYRGMGERASRVRMPRCDLRRVEAERRSGRTGQSHSIGGFTGEAEYEGELSEFLPYLQAAKWTGVGRQTVWGKGEIEVLEPA